MRFNVANTLPLVIVLMSVSFLAIPLNSYFSQDDFFHLRLIMDKNWTDIPTFFVSWLKDQTFYRPLSREVSNLLIYKIFGLQPWPFHLINLIFIFMNSYFSYLLFKKINKDSKSAILATCFYLLSAVHSIELYYLASLQTLMATLFSLLSSYFFYLYIDKHAIKSYFLAIVFFTLALLSHESAVVLPLILIGLYFVHDRSFGNLKLTRFLSLAPFALFALLRVIIMLTYNYLPSQQVYTPDFHLNKIANTLMWYSLWSFGLPETLVDFIGPGLKINPNFLRWYPVYSKITFPLVAILIGSVLLISISKAKRMLSDRILLLYIFFYIVSLTPFLFFPQHKFVYYLTHPSVWFSAALARVFLNLLNRKILIAGYCIAFAVVSISTLLLNDYTYWAAKRAKAAKYLISEVKKNFPEVPKGALFYFKNDPGYPNIAKEWGGSSTQAFYILSGNDALTLLYKDKSIKAYYEDFQKNELVKDLRLLPVIARFPY